MAEHAAGEELAELILDEAGQAVSVAAARDSRRKGSRCSWMTAWRTECSVSRG
jgi:hypothetical protein